MNEAGKVEGTKDGSRTGQKDSNKLGALILSPSVKSKCDLICELMELNITNSQSKVGKLMIDIIYHHKEECFMTCRCPNNENVG